MEEMQRKMDTEKKEKEQIQADMAVLREQYERDLASIDQQAKYVKSPGQQRGMSCSCVLLFFCKHFCLFLILNKSDHLCFFLV